jgi:predicted metal-binding membrane protein
MAMAAAQLQGALPVQRRGLTAMPAEIGGATEAALPVGTSLRHLGLWLAIAGWTSMVLMWGTGTAELFGHDQGDASAGLAIGLFLIGWLVMVAAMMLPSSLPTLGRVDQELVAGTRSPAPRFMTGYFLTWAALGAAAFVGDGILHLLVDRLSWLAQRPSLIVGGMAMFAGAAEMLGRPPPPVLPSASRDRGAFALGQAHVFDRVRRCWPLMLFAMAVGMSSPAWMVGLTLVMALELLPGASTALRLIGLGVFAVGVAVVLEPHLMPVLVGTA